MVFFLTSTTFREGALFTFAEYLAISIAFARYIFKADLWIRAELGIDEKERVKKLERIADVSRVTGCCSW